MTDLEEWQRAFDRLLSFWIPVAVFGVSGLIALVYVVAVVIQAI